MNHQTTFKEIASQVQLFQSIEQKETFIFVLSALTSRLREGVPKEDIVLAFHDPETRKFTEFAIA
ncbi:element excision factor XisI family protein [Aphanizomenon sp. CS-733/32]|nr:element excision factor XisI family protein [Aphanizomenon sp. CS-733/32]MDB9310544.1 element excision factor XisI family protein [Aphanizomenon sp. CS-733/32]